MYLNFYGLREEPFGVTPDPQFLFLSPSYREAQATLEYSIRTGRGFSVLVGSPGIGKTTLLFDLLQRYSGSARTAFIFLTQCDSREFLRYLMSELGADSVGNDFVRLQEQFGRLLAQESRAGKKVIIVVDEGQNLDISVLETVRLLSDFETARAKLLHIILTGQPELAGKLASPALLQLRQRISNLVHLRPLSPGEMQQYIEHRLKVAGYSGAPLFTPEARAMIFQRSQGIPRVVNTLCFNALSLGCALRKRTIDTQIMNEVSGDLDLEAIVHGAAGQRAVEVQAAAPDGGGPADEEARSAPHEAASIRFDDESAALAAVASAQAAPGHSEPAAQPGVGPDGQVLGPVLVPAAAARDGAECQHTDAIRGQLALDIDPLLAEPASGAHNGNGRGELQVVEKTGDPLAAGKGLQEPLQPESVSKMLPDVPVIGSGLADNAAVLRASAGRSSEVMQTAAPRVYAGRNLAQTGAPPASRVRGSGGMTAARSNLRRPPARMVRRKRRLQRSFYLAFIACLAGLLLLSWLLQSSGPPGPAPASTPAAVQNARPARSSPTP